MIHLRLLSLSLSISFQIYKNSYTALFTVYDVTNE